MTYRIAHVRFARADRTYPVNCHRADLRPGDRVIVEMPKKRCLKVAEVDRVEHLNWDCANTLLCRESEFRTNSDGSWFVDRSPGAGERIETLEDLGNALRRRGWEAYSPTGNVWRTAYTKSMAHVDAVIAARANGIDFQLISGPTNLGISGTSIAIRPRDGRFVRHSYYASAVDVIELAFDFAVAADQPGSDLDRFFAPVGTKRPKPARDADDLSELRRAINGDLGGPAYLGDDVWI
ncbi:MAG: hypothetical protein ACTHJK_05345 [Sphingomicrobium sp.]